MIKKRKKKVWKRDFAVEVDQKVAKRGVSYLTEPEPRKRRERGELKRGEEVADDDSVAENQSQKYFCFLFLPLHSLSLSFLFFVLGMEPTNSGCFVMVFLLRKVKGKEKEEY